ncbi:sugar phosphate isomerase/epimerase family protein [Mucilaginibacter boryungensis]|uniref:Sugar phosphate isomerase/epimerase n=1 Tax=Mucilaginibacter boryungensis TaxID=768480 RepID=A0ABR9XFK7_9SPHI|nr:sugar phosphate isomerase/epimerase [Mucilaginibacter boryungensis]MBE9666179.1 sugar phosphate isomerase/epimerase [Mucilaginibacter boryungensis]
MDIKFYAPRWGSEAISWPDFAEKVKVAGFDGVEVYPLESLHEKDVMLQAITDNGLDLALIHSEVIEGRNFGNYKNALIKNLYILAGYQTNQIKPKFINSHTGKDYYTQEQMAECFAICDISKEIDIPIIHETHRNKWSFAAHVTKAYLQQFPDVRLALDLSHWVCVAETYLQDQDEAVELALQHADHIHARVGHIEGPQVTDPRSPENAEALQHHLQWWDRWIALQKEKGRDVCTITPEFGPYPYMSYQCNTNNPVADQWAINCYMKDLLKNRYQTT